MGDERLDHVLWDAALDHFLTAVVVNRQLFEGERCRFSDLEAVIFQELLEALEHEVKHTSTDSTESELTLEESGLLLDFSVFVLEKCRTDVKDFIIDHLVCRFLYKSKLILKALALTSIQKSRRTYLVMNTFIESLECISNLVGLELVVQKDIFELRDHSIEDSGCNLNEMKRLNILTQLELRHSPDSPDNRTEPGQFLS